MSWEIVDRTQVAEYCRVTQSELQDIWYDTALALIEDHTGWYSLTEAEDITEYVNGPGNAVLVPKFPINSVTSIYLSGQLLPATYYYMAWNQLEVRTYRENESFDLTVQLDRTTRWGDIFPYGVRNIQLTYNAGSTVSLPNRHLGKLKAALLMIIKEFSAIPRTEGSDSIMKKYRPDRTLLPEEVLTSYGTHGKINGILNSIVPKQRVYL